MLAFRAQGVHPLADVAHGGDRLCIRRVAHVDPADLEVLAVEAPGRNVVGILMPVRADYATVAQRAFEVTAIRGGALGLVPELDQPARIGPRSSAPKWNSPMMTGLSMLEGRRLNLERSRL